MARYFTPLKDEYLTENCCGYENIGLQIVVKLTAGSIWSCRRAGKYFALSKKGTGVIVRCTQAALDRHFKEVQ